MKVAYFITFRCYGTWLHGDERGSVDETHKTYGEAFIEANEAQQRFRKRLINGVQQNLDLERRQCVRSTIEEVAAHRGWVIHALNIRSNHIHLVIGAEAAPEKVMNDFKAYSTRRLREQKLLPNTAQIWAEHGSTVYLWDFLSFEAACDYVLNQQDKVGQLTEPEA